MFWWMFVPIYRTSTESDDVTLKWAMVVLVATCGFALSCLVLAMLAPSDMFSTQLIRGATSLVLWVSLVGIVYAFLRVMARSMPLWWYGSRER